MAPSTAQSAIAVQAPGFHAFHADANINYQLNRFLIAGRENMFRAIGHQLSDFEDWQTEFLARAYECEAAGELDVAAQLYRAAEFFISPRNPERRRAYERFFDLFYRAHPELVAARIEIPYAGRRLHALRIRTSGVARGTIVIHAGFDAYIEEFVDIGRFFGAAGYEVVMFDGPGQGTTLMRDGLPMTADWEKPVTATLDHLGIADATLLGISLGGCLALRAAAALGLSPVESCRRQAGCGEDPRLVPVVSDPGDRTPRPDP